MDESQDKISSDRKRLEKNESEGGQPVATQSEGVVTANTGQNLSTVQSLNAKPEAKLRKPGTCYLISQPIVPVTTAGTKAPASNGKIIKIISSTGNYVLVCTIKVPSNGGKNDVLGLPKTEQPNITKSVSPQPISSQTSSTSFPKQTAIHPNVVLPRQKEETRATPLSTNLIASSGGPSTIQSNPSTISTTIYHTTNECQINSSLVSDKHVATVPEHEPSRDPREGCTNHRHDNTCQVDQRSTVQQSTSKGLKYETVENVGISSNATNEKRSSLDGQHSPSTPRIPCHNPFASTIANNGHRFKKGQIDSPSFLGKLPCYPASTTNKKMVSTTVSVDHRLKNGLMDSLSIPSKLPCHDLPTTNHQQDSTPTSSKLTCFDHLKQRNINSTTTNDGYRSGNGLTYSPSTSSKLPGHIQTATQPKDSPLRSRYLDTPSWDPPYHHIEYNDIIPALPNDLQYLKESELLPLAREDFTKYLENGNLYHSPNEIITSADDDGVVPSSSPPLPGDGDTYMDSSSDGSQEYTWEGFASRGENIYKSPSGTRLDYPLYGTLNWGLTPTIIYKTPEPDISWEDVGDDYMKCSISAGNVELLTPPPANYKKLLRRSRRRMERRSVKRRRIYFESDEHDDGLQEVPVNESEKDLENTLDTDNFVPDDPMWFEDDAGEDGGEEKSFSDGITEQDIADCYENLRNALPNSDETTDPFHLLNEAVEYIRDLEETIDDFSGDCNDTKVEVQEDNEREKSTELNATCGDVLKTLPKFSFDDIDEQSSHEIQEILHSINQSSEETCELSVDAFCEEPSTDLVIQDKKQNTRKKNRRRNSNGKQKISKKKKSSSQNEITQTCDDSITAQCSPDSNSRSKRSVSDCSPSSKTSSRSNSRAGSRCVTPIAPKLPPGVLLSPSLSGLIHLPPTGSPFILPKPPSEGGCFSPPPLRSQMTSPNPGFALRVIPTASSVPTSDPPNLQKAPPDPSNSTRRTASQCVGLGEVVKVLPVRKWCLRSGNIQKGKADTLMSAKTELQNDK